MKKKIARRLRPGKLARARPDAARFTQTHEMLVESNQVGRYVRPDAVLFVIAFGNSRYGNPVVMVLTNNELGWVWREDIEPLP